MSKATQRPTLPQSVRHKRILDLAEERPKASLEDLAADVPTATADLVEHVLEKYGDPAAPDDASDGDLTDEQTADQHPLSVEDLGEKQRDTLGVIATHPDATQREIAEKLEVTAGTVNRRVNAIDGFDWNDRREIVERLGEELPIARETDTMSPEKATLNGEAEQIIERIVALESQLEAVAPHEREQRFDAELSHKVIHACMASELFSEDEELRLIREMFRA